MQTIVQLVQVIAPLVTVAIFLMGLRAWYWQLVAKRKFEIAEQAIIVFRRANDALSRIRSPIGWSSEHERVKIPDGLSEEKQKLYRQYGIYYDRAQAEQNAKPFEEVRLIQILAEVHISTRAAQCFEVLFRARHLALVAAHMLIEDHNQYLPPAQRSEQQKRRLQYHADLYEIRRTNIPKDEDRLSRAVDEASKVLEVECTSKLRPPTFKEFVFGQSPGTSNSEWSDITRDVLALPKKNPE